MSWVIVLQVLGWMMEQSYGFPTNFASRQIFFLLYMINSKIFWKILKNSEKKSIQALKFSHNQKVCNATPIFTNIRVLEKFWKILKKKSIYRISLNNVLPYIMSSLEYYPPFFPKYSHNQYIKFQNLQLLSHSENVKIIYVVGHYLRKYGTYGRYILR